MRTITKRVVFCAAHHIPGAGKCERVHGHNWEARIKINHSGSLDKQGFIVDVREVKDAAFKYDHDDLNKYFDVPSTEIIAQQIADDVHKICKNSASTGTYRVEVHLIETENNTATAYANG